jgi:hypothetical protein
MGAGCSFQCKMDIKAKKGEGKTNNKPKKFSSFSDKPRKPLATRSPLKAKTALKTSKQLKSGGTLKNHGMTGIAAKEVKATKKAKAAVKLAITPALKDKPSDDKDALEAAAITSCHRYIRKRDYGKPCPCCGMELGENYHAGHYHEAGNNSAIKFDERNIRGQRADCNTCYGGDRGDYEPNLRILIGSEEVDDLNQIAESGVIKRYTAQDYIDIKIYYDSKYQELEKTETEVA